MKRKCPICGNLIDLDYFFCDKCGNRVNDGFEYVEDYPINETPSPEKKPSIIKSLLAFLGIYISYSYILPFIITFIYIVLNAISPTSFPDPNIMTDKSYALLNIIINLVNDVLVIIMLIILLKLTKRTKEILGPQRIPTSQKISTSITNGMITFAMMYGAIYILGIFSMLLFPSITEDNANQELVSSYISDFPFLGFLLVVVFAPIVEEFVFRFFLCKPLEKSKKWLGVIVSAIIFGGVHLIASIETGTFIEDLPSLVLYVGMGFVLSYRYATTDNITSNILAHSAYNFISFLTILLL